MSNSKKTVKGEFSNMYGDGKNLNTGKNKPVKELLNNIKNSNLNTNQLIENNIKNSKNSSNTSNNTSNKTDKSNKTDTSNKNDRTNTTNISNKPTTNFKSRITSLFSSTKNENEKVIQPTLIDKSLERKETLSLPSIPTFSIQSPFKMIYFILIILVLLTVGLIYLYRDMFVYFFDSIFGSKTQDAQKKQNAEIIKNSQYSATNSAYTSSKIDDTAQQVKVASDKVDVTSAKINDLDKKVDSLIKTTNEKCSGKNCPTVPAAPALPAVSELNNKLNTVSKTNSPKESNLSEDGYCYIGYDNGQRECIATYGGETCMSGEIFPSLDICINPKIKSRPIS